MSVFGSAEERAKAEMAERGDTEGGGGWSDAEFPRQGQQQATSATDPQESSKELSRI